jgi:Flp pilus assembly pilin Flp
VTDEAGATAIEYALIVSLIFLAIIDGVTAFGNKTLLKYDYIGTEIGKAM